MKGEKDVITRGLKRESYKELRRLEDTSLPSPLHIAFYLLGFYLGGEGQRELPLPPPQKKKIDS